jgi:hypothetical protein
VAPSVANPNPSEPTPSFDYTGKNLGGGQNAVQVATSDAIPVQVFANPTVSTAINDPKNATPWLHTVGDPGYGSGNTYLPASTFLGTPNSGVSYQNPSVLNMPSTAVNPRSMTSADFGTSAGSNPDGTNSTNAGLENLNSQLLAVTATLFVANPGTGLTQVSKTDAQWLQLQSRLANGATFNMTTRDVNSGTRNVAALETGIDPTWASGMNDNGNGNSATGGTDQISIGAGLRFSNKTAGGGELLPTVQSARMAVGTLSINDASGFTLAGTGSTNPIRALSYSNSGAPNTFVGANFYTIQNGSYPIFQNEQFVTLQAPDANYGSGINPATGLSNEDIQGDDANGDVKALLNNTLTSVAAFTNAGVSTAASPAAGLMNSGYIIPQLMEVRKAENGQEYTYVDPNPASPTYGQTITTPYEPNTTGFGATTLTQYNSSLSPTSGLINTLAMGDPTQVTSGSASSVYGGNKVRTSAPNFQDQIKLTSANYLFGNFNENGVRDFGAAVVQAQVAQNALETGGSPAGDSAFSGSLNATRVTTGIASLDAITGQTTNTTGATKGDLITMGDYNGDGVFDGKDLYALAFGASLADASNPPVLTGTGSSTALTPGTGTITVPAGENFGQVISSAVLFKNTALDYLQAKATTLQKQEARVTFTEPTGTTPAPSYAGVPATLVSTNLNGSGVDVYTLDDANGDNAFNIADVNHDGQINLDDAFVVDKFAGESYTSQDDQEAATINGNGTIDPTLADQKPFSLVAATLVDYGSNDPAVNKIQQGDENVVNAALTGTVFNYAWYNGETKVGSLDIKAEPASGSVIEVPSGATFTISNGAFTAGGAVDPLTDSSSTGIDTNKSLNVVVKGTGSLDYAARTGVGGDTGIKLYKLDSLTVQSGGSAALASAPSPANRSVLAVGALSFPNSTGTLDLANNDLIVHNGTLGTVSTAGSLTQEIAAGQAGHWTGSVGITSSAAAAATNTALGVELNNNGSGGVLMSSFDGEAVTTSDVLVKYTFAGDADLSGTVNGSDYTLIDNGFNSQGSADPLSGWHNGDFNYDGVINGDDYILIDNSFNTEGSTSFAASSAGPAEMIAGDTEIIATPAVPEPSSLGVIGIGAVALLGKRRRR